MTQTQIPSLLRFLHERDLKLSTQVKVIKTATSMVAAQVKIERALVLMSLAAVWMAIERIWIVTMRNRGLPTAMMRELCLTESLRESCLTTKEEFLQNLKRKALPS